jgi:hypothetical protein
MQPRTNLDATAGKRARETTAHTAGTGRNLDATDPRYGALESRPRPRDPESFMDHTDPQHREPPDLAA